MGMHLALGIVVLLRVGSREVWPRATTSGFLRHVFEVALMGRLLVQIRLRIGIGTAFWLLIIIRILSSMLLEILFLQPMIIRLLLVLSWLFGLSVICLGVWLRSVLSMSVVVWTTFSNGMLAK